MRRGQMSTIVRTLTVLTVAFLMTTGTTLAAAANVAC
jgi:hypothetical protein